MAWRTDRSAESVGLHISHIGGYSRKKYPNSVHWHFKRDRNERGNIDAAFWDAKSLSWLMLQQRNAPWVKARDPKLRKRWNAKSAFYQRRNAMGRHGIVTSRPLLLHGKIDPP